MSSPRFEAFLARLYTDEAALAAFLCDPRLAASNAGLDELEAAALTTTDRAGLVMAARSFAAKRSARIENPGRRRSFGRLLGRIRAWRCQAAGGEDFLR